MAKHAVVEFDRELGHLFDRRTDWLKRHIRKPSQGKPPTFKRSDVEKAIENLEGLVEDCLLYEYAVKGHKTCFDVKKQWQVTRSKGWGTERKRKAFMKWFDNVIPYDNCVYVFWASSKCRYVGRTLNGKNRPQSHFAKEWFPTVTRIDIYASRLGRSIPKLECLQTHRFAPTHSKIKPSKRKWYTKCPICQTKGLVRSDVKALFRLK